MPNQADDLANPSETSSEASRTSIRKPWRAPTVILSTMPDGTSKLTQTYEETNIVDVHGPS